MSGFLKYQLTTYAVAGEREQTLVEDYPEDPRGHSHLVLGFTEADQPVHAA